MHEKINVAHEATPPLFMPVNLDTDDYGDADTAGPGGTTNRIENNEKGILETAVFRTLARHTQAALGSDHDSYAQGIYTSHHGTDYMD